MERWRGARLRHHTCFALAEVNAAIGALLPARPARPGPQLPGARHRLVATLDRPAWQPRPGQPSASAAWKRARVNMDAHGEGDGHASAGP